MAENESLDFGNNLRMRVVYEAIRNGAFRLFLLQLARLRDIENHDRLPAAFERHIVGTGIVRKGQSQKEIIQFLARYRDEWTVIASAARERGHAWARLFSSKRPVTQGVAHASA